MAAGVSHVRLWITAPPPLTGHTHSMDDAPWTRNERARIAEHLTGISMDTAHMLADALGLTLDTPATCDDERMDHVPYPPHPKTSHYPRRIAAWVVQLVEPDLRRAVPELANHPRAAGRVAWATTQAIIRARGRDEPGPLAMSAVIGPDLLTGLLPDEDVAMLRAVELDISDAPDAGVLVERLERLTEVGKHLPRHFLT